MTESKKTGPRLGSRSWMIARLEPGDCLLLCVPEGRTTQSFMQNIASDVTRNGLTGVVHQSLVLGVEPGPRKLFDIVKIERDPLPPVKVAAKRKPATKGTK